MTLQKIREALEYFVQGEPKDGSQGACTYCDMGGAGYSSRGDGHHDDMRDVCPVIRVQQALALLDQMQPVSREEFMNAVHDERSKCEIAARESTYWARWAYDFLASRTVVDFPSEEEMQEIAIDLAARSGDYIRESLTALFNRIKTVSVARSEGEKG
jgi:hypothetical protein